MDERRDDWRHGVDENLASLNAGQRVWERELVVIRKLLGEFDRLLRGDTEKETDGLIARLHQQEVELNRIRAVLFKDVTGKGGLLDDVKNIKEGREDRRLGWRNITKVAVAVITSGALGLFWHDIQTFINKKTSDPVELMLENSKHRQTRRHHAIIREEPELDPEN
jgi:hypothetical protein